MPELNRLLILLSVDKKTGPEICSNSLYAIQLMPCAILPHSQDGKSTSPKPLPLPLGLLLILQIGEMVISRQIISLSHRVLVWQELP